MTRQDIEREAEELGNDNTRWDDDRDHQAIWTDCDLIDFAVRMVNKALEEAEVRWLLNHYADRHGVGKFIAAFKISEDI